MVAYDYDQEDWGAQRVFADGELSGTWVPDKWIIHYGGNASLGATEPASIDAEMRALRIYEQSHLSRGWRAIGYNYAFGQSGKVYRLRGENMSGATSGDYEDDGIPENNEGRAVLWIGGKGQVPSEAALASLQRLINDGDLDTVIAHSDVKGNTNCPGDPLREWIHNEKYKEYGMPLEQFKNMINALFIGRPDLFHGDPGYFYKTKEEGGILDDPDNPDWADYVTGSGFWPAFVRLIGGDV